MHQFPHDGRSITDHRRIADEPGDTRVRADPNAIADVGAVNYPSPVTDHAPVPDPSTVLHHALGADHRAFMDNNLIEEQTPVSEYNRGTRRRPSALGFPETSFLRIPQHAMLADNHRITEPNRPI